jgi:hypothetical protein
MTAVSRRELFSRTGQSGLAAGVGALVAHSGCVPLENLVPPPDGQGDGTGAGNGGSTPADLLPES